MGHLQPLDSPQMCVRLRIYLRTKKFVTMKLHLGAALRQLLVDRLVVAEREALNVPLVICSIYVFKMREFTLLSQKENKSAADTASLSA